MKKFVLPFALCCSFGLCSRGAEGTLGRPFFFQGVLRDSTGVVTSTNADLRVGLFDLATGGNQTGSWLLFPNTPVRQGFVSLPLDFESGAFAGGDRFLEFQIRTTGAPGGYQILSPRQPITPVPLALHALTSSSESGSSAKWGQFALGRDFPSALASESFGLLPGAVRQDLRVWSPYSIYWHTGGYEQPRGQIDSGGNLSVLGSYHGAGYWLPFGSRFYFDQGGSLELGANNGETGPADSPYQPYVDFHYAGWTGDYSVRMGIVGERKLRFQAMGSDSLPAPAEIEIDGGLSITSGNSFRFGDGMLGFSSSADGRNSGSFLELRGKGYGQFIDFSNNLESDFHARLILSDNNTLSLFGAILEVPALKIVGGADIAENFDSVESSEILKPGTVVSYVPDGSQRIERSTLPSDARVAGVISDAGGISPGVILEQLGTSASGVHKVAMLGRVKVWADASAGAIKVGDLLVSSATPGHAMKAPTSSPLPGTILGKATSNLESGRALIWMHVGLR